MVSPFRRPERQSIRRRVADLLDGSAQRAEQEQMDMARASAIVEWSANPYHRVFLEWLRNQADRPIATEAHGLMIEAASRSNTLREVLQYLQGQERKARALLEMENAR